MRLTLRTLLAYTDDILDPADHEDLGRKIEASDFATELIHRTRDTVRRLRLGAPDVFAGGGDDILESVNVADANAVSEYLDNTLPAEDVADFERMCLEPGNEADMHLAEVASCHHVLTMVLGEPAEIDVDVRRRMYELPSQETVGQQVPVEPTPLPPQPLASEEVPPTTAPPRASTPPTQYSAEADVPDYLRAAAAQRQRKKRWIAATVFLALAAGVVGFFLPAMIMEPELPADLAESDLESINMVPMIESVGEPDGSSEDGQESTDADFPGAAPPFVPDVAAGDSESSPGVTEAEPDPLSVAPAAGENEPKPVEGVGVEREFPTDLDAEASAVVAEPGDTEPKALATAAPAAAPLDSPPTATDAPVEDPEMTTPVDADDKSPVFEVIEGVPAVEGDVDLRAAPEPAGPKQLGNYLGNNDVLLRRNESQGKWTRLAPRSAISAGDSLLALPKFRPHVVLADVNTYLSGGTRLDLPVGDTTLAGEQVDLELAVVYGRVLLNAGLKGGNVGLHVGDDVRQVQLAGSTSLAVEVQPVFVPGSDNEQQPSPVEAVWYLTSGSVEWPGPSGEPQFIEGPAIWKTVAGIDDLPQVIDALPEWIDREPMTDLQRRARDTMVDELAPGEPVGLRLMELNDQRDKGRRQEVRTLAAESSVYVGQFEPFVKALSDKAQRRAWDSHIKTLRQALALSPQAAVKVREAFVDVRGEQAAGDLMEMIAGFSREAIGQTRLEVQEGALVNLIRWLEHDSLDYRVLAIYNLNEITGTTSLKGFHPDDSASRRKISIAKIRDSLESNELLPKP